MNVSEIFSGSRLRLPWVIGAALSLPVLMALAQPIPAPSWSADPTVTFQSYLFTTDSLTPTPDSVANAFGDPEAWVVFVPYIGVGTGWQDPDQISIQRDGGAWDLGPDGSITVSVPFAPPTAQLEPGYRYLVNLFVQVVYEPTPGFYHLPDIILSTMSVVESSTNPMFAQDGFFWWGLLTGESTFETLTSNSVTVLIDATGSTGSLVDTVVIYTRYEVIPEPHTVAFALGCVALLTVMLVRRRRSGSG